MTSTGIRLWTQDEYHRMTEAGILDPDERVELLEGQIISMAAKNPPHKAESDQIVVALRDLGREVKYLVAPNEGHGFRGETNQLAVTAAIENFFAPYLGGRYQESMSPEVKKQLQALTVDVRTVKAPESVSGSRRRGGEGVTL